MDVKGKTVWITGASSGIGEALSKELAGYGANLILSARSKNTLDSLRLSLPHPDLHKVVCLDLSESTEMLRCIDRALEEGVSPDILINNAGVSQRGEAREVALLVHRKVMEINYFNTVAMTQALLPTLLENKGMVVTVSSVAGKVGGQGMSAYAASKHAIIGYMDCLRAEESNNGLQVLTICPGFVRTNISLNALTKNGTKYGAMAESIEQGISAEFCAKKIHQSITNDRKEVVIGKGLSRWAPMIKRIAPGMLMEIAAKKNIR